MTLTPAFLSFTIGSFAGGALIIANSPTEAGVKIGSAAIGAAIAGVVGAVLSDAIPQLRIPNVTGRRRLLATWGLGMLTVTFSSNIHEMYFPKSDIVMVTAGVAAVGSLFGASLLMIALPALANAVRRKLAPKKRRRKSGR